MPNFGAFVQGAVCLSVILLVGVASAQISHPILGNKPPQPAAQSNGVCFNYQLTVVSNNSDYFYTCCDRLGGVTVKTDNEIKIPTSNYDCNPFRLNRTEITQQPGFTCNGKQKAETRCNRRWGWLSIDDCWVWSACFAEACKLESQAAETVCGDGQCDSLENTASCPLDCCPVENPDTCIIKNSTCSRLCCGESTCCQSNNEPLSVSSDFWLIAGAVLAAVLCLFYICCCCCCYCCTKLYNSMFRPSKKRRHSFILSGAGAH